MRDGIVDRMTKLYLMFAVPVAIVDPQTGEVQLSITWTNPEAERLYERYEEILNNLPEVNRPDLGGETRPFN
jgi:hypothetical protein